MPTAFSSYNNLPLQYLPAVNWTSNTSSVTDRETINSTATSPSESNITVAAENSPIPILYGLDIVASPLIVYALNYGGMLVLAALWGHGEIEGITMLYRDDTAINDPAYATHYYGAQTAPDPTLVAAFAAQGITYTDTLNGYAYSVLKVPAGATSGFPRFMARIRGIKVLDPRKYQIGINGAGYLSTPSSTENSLSTDFTISTKINLSGSWIPTSTVLLAYKEGSYRLKLLTNGYLSLEISLDGSTYSTSYSPTPLTSFNLAGISKWVSVTRTEASGLVEFFSSDDGIKWTSLGNRTSITGNLFNSTSNLIVGEGLVGKLLYTRIYKGTSLSVSLDPADHTGGFSFTSAITGEEWTINGSLSIRQSTPEASDNPAVNLSDFIKNTTYGMGKSVNEASVIKVANFNDEIVVDGSLQERRRTLNISIDKVQTCTAWLDTLKTYAGCWVIQSNTEYKLIPDGPIDYEPYLFLHDATTLTTEHSVIKNISNITKKGIRDVPTVMRLNYTNSSKIPVLEGNVTVTSDLITSRGRKESLVSLPGINRESQARREAIERLNKLVLCDLTFTLEVYDEGAIVEVGDVIGVIHPIGIGVIPEISGGEEAEPKYMRVLSVSETNAIYTLNVEEYNPSVYSNEIVSTPDYEDTYFNSPSSPPTPPALVIGPEEVYQQANGLWSSRLRATWDTADYPFTAHYKYRLDAVDDINGLYVADTGTLSRVENTYVINNVVENTTYTLYLWIVSNIGAVSDTPAVSNSVEALGKYLIPSDVPSISGFEAGGTVYLSWSPAIDKDIYRYEVRYYNVGETWDHVNAKTLDLLDSLTLQTDMVPSGTFVFGVKALDSVGQYSENATEITITVTSDSSAFFVDSFSPKYVDPQNNTQYGSVTSTGMVFYSLGSSDPTLYYVTEDEVPFADKFTSALSTYSNPLATYNTVSTSTLISEPRDFGTVISGQWTMDSTVVDLSGTSSTYTGLSLNGISYTYYLGTSHKTNARGARFKHESTGTLLVKIPTQELRVDAVAKDEVGELISSTTGPTTVVLTNKYTAVKQLVLTPYGTTVRTAIPDNIRINGFINSTDMEGVLQFDSEVSASATGDQYISYKFATASGAIVSGDKLEYDILLAKSTSNTIVPGGVLLRFSDSSYSTSTYEECTLGTWHSREYSLDAYIGKDISWFNIFNDMDATGEYSICVRNVRITNGGSVTQQAYNVGSPTLNVLDVCTSDIIDYGLNQANSFDVYILDNTNTKIESSFRYLWKGI